MSTFTLTLDSGDFPLASEFFSALAAAFDVFRSPVLRNRAAPAAPVTMPAPAPVDARAAEPAEAPAAEVEQPKTRKPRAPKADPAPTTPETAPAATAAPAADAPAKSDDELLAELRQLGNQVIDSAGGPAAIMELLGSYGVRKWPDLSREQRLECVAKLRAKLGA